MLLTGAIVVIIAVVAGIFFFRKRNPSIPSPTSTPPVTDDTEAAPQGNNSIVNANNQFALDFYSELKEREKGNIFFSPYSIAIALAMTYEGARGKTAEEIQSTFRFSKDDSTRGSSIAVICNRLNQKDAKYKLHTANALWVQKDYQLRSEFLEIIEKYFFGKATTVDFAGAVEEVRRTINHWVENQTNGKIKDFFPQGSLNSLSRLVLTSAIYFKGSWVKQFDKEKTTKKEFRVKPGFSVQVPMMCRTDKKAWCNYAETKDLQVLEMLYEGQALSMLILLPEKDDLTSLEKTLTLKKLSQWKSALRTERVNVFLPKFTFNSRYSMNAELKKMGMPSAFNPDAADFSGIDGTKNLFIGTVIHQAFVDVNEEGTEAAAATGVALTGSAGGFPNIWFLANHPFLFLIQERATGIILFIGRVVNPSV